MALILNHFYSDALTECNSMNIIIPLESAPKDRYPLLWLIPPAGKDHTAWQRSTRIEQIATQLGIMVVMPDMKLSYGVNMIHGLSYFTMLTKELPALISDYFPADMSRQYIAGAKEGGYAALRAALKYPELYSAVSIYSCGSLTDEDSIKMEWQKKQLSNAFGCENLYNLGHTDHSLAYLLEQGIPPHLKISFAYGSGDRYRRSAQKLNCLFEDLNSKQVQTRLFRYKLTWTDWEKLLYEDLCYLSQTPPAPMSFSLESP